MDNNSVTAEDIRTYYTSFRHLVETSGEYSAKTKMLQNATDGVPKVQMIAYQYYHSDLEGKLTNEISRLKAQQISALVNLQYWSKKVGFKPMSTPDDVEKYHLTGHADTDKLLHYLAYTEFRKRLYYRIDRYSKRGELKSAADLITEVLGSFKKKPRQPS